MTILRSLCDLLPEWPIILWWMFCWDESACYQLRYDKSTRVGGPCPAPAKSRHSFVALIIAEICFYKPSCCISAFWEWGTAMLNKFGYSFTVITATSSLLGALVFLVLVFANCSTSLWQALCCFHTDWCRAEEEGGTTGNEATRVASSQNVH